MRTLVFLLATSGCAGPDDANPDGGAPPPGDGPNAPSKRALVELRLEPPLFSGQEPRLQISGGFLLASDPRCKRTVMNECEVSDCPQALIGNDYADPGKLSFAPSGGLISWTPGPSFLSFSANTVPWAADETITLTSAGAEVPAFTAQVASPRTLDAGEGRSPFGPPLVRSQPFTVTWRPVAEEVQIQMRQGRDTADGPFEILVVCQVPGASGIARVQPPALAKFIPTAFGGLSVRVTAHAQRKTVVDAGDFAVTYRVLRSFDESFSHDVE